ncbi:MAG: TrkA C-terminal domain-containing protein [Halobacteriales archaeon]
MLQVAIDDAIGLGVRLVALAALAGAIGLAAAAVYRWYLREELPQGIALLAGASAIALALNTTATLGESIGGTTDLLDPRAGAFAITAILAGGVACEGGRRVGDVFGARLGVSWGLGIDAEVSAFVKGVGRVVRVELPETIDDIDGYDPVRPELKADLAGAVLSFPGRLTLEELREAFVTRLNRDHGIGKVDVEFAPDASVEYLAVGRGRAGIGHTLPPGEVAVAIRGDPAYSASPGDQVRIWRAGDEPTRVTAGEVRGIVDDVVTVSVPEAAAGDMTAEAGYRLVTHPGGRHVDREFAAILRRADEAVASVAVEPGADLVGRRVAALEVTVLTVEVPDGSVLALPSGEAVLEAGQRVAAIGRPDELRRFEAAAQGTS